MWWVVWSCNPFMNELTKQNMQKKSQQKTFALSLSHANIVTIDSCNFDPWWLLIIIFWCCHLTSFNEENIETSRNVILFFFVDTKKSSFFQEPLWLQKPMYIQKLMRMWSTNIRIAKVEITVTPHPPLGSKTNCIEANKSINEKWNRRHL